VAHEQQVVAGLCGSDRRLAHGAALHDRAHLEIVGDDRTAEPEFPAQVVLDDQAREGRRHARGIEVRIDGMARHHAVDAGRDRLEKGRQMGRVHLCPRRLDDGQGQVGIERRVALAGEVLGARRQALSPHAADPRRAVAGDDRRVLAVRADADIGAVALGEHVEDGGEVQIHPEPA